MNFFKRYGRKMSQMAVSVTAVVAISCFAASAFAGIRMGSNSSSMPLEVSFKVVKPIVNVGDRVRFKVKGNKQFYLYLFTISDSGQAHVILPNKLQQYNIYKPGLDYIVPEKDLEFYADAPGTEEVIMVATTKKLTVNTHRFKEAGQFYSASKEVVQAEVKELKVRSHKVKAQQVATNLRFTVVGRPQVTSEPPAEALPVVTEVSCDRSVYHDGENVIINYGADVSGYIYLWYRDGNNMPNFLKKEYVEGGHSKQLTAIAEAPYGKHTLYAVWSADGEAASKDLFDKNITAKGLSLQPDSDGQSANYSFTITQ